MTDRTPQQQIDTRAIEIAASALAKIDSHEKDCARRQDDILGKFREQSADRLAFHGEFNASLRRFYGVLWKGAVGLIMVLLACLGYMVDKFGLPGSQRPQQQIERAGGGS